MSVKRELGRVLLKFRLNMIQEGKLNHWKEFQPLINSPKFVNAQHSLHFKRQTLTGLRY